MKRLLFVLPASLSLLSPGFAGTNGARQGATILKDTPVSCSGSVLPGTGLKQHDFLYAGEWDIRKDLQTIKPLISGDPKGSAREVAGKGGTVREFTRKGLPPLKFSTYRNVCGWTMATPLSATGAPV